MKIWGQNSFFGLAVAVAACAIDQAFKWWMLSVYDIGTAQPVRITSFFDLVLVWNRGISYGLFQQDSVFGRYALIAIMACAMLGLFVWLARSQGRLSALALGAILGGAAGNIIDRTLYGAVADFFSFHAMGYNWYVFNLADIAIVAGVAIVLYESLIETRS